MIAKLLLLASAILAMTGATVAIPNVRIQRLQADIDEAEVPAAAQRRAEPTPTSEIQFFMDAACKVPVSTKMGSTMPFSSECQQYPITVMKMSAVVNCEKVDEGKVRYHMEMYMNSLTCSADGGKLQMSAESVGLPGDCVKTDAFMNSSHGTIYSRVTCDQAASDAAAKYLAEMKASRK